MYWSVSAAVGLHDSNGGAEYQKAGAGYTLGGRSGSDTFEGPTT